MPFVFGRLRVRRNGLYRTWDALGLQPVGNDPRAVEIGSKLKMYVGNLSFDATESSVRSLFEEFGNVSSVNLIMDRETGRPRGFGFVEMSDNSAANAAMAKLNGAEFQGRNLNINEARAREERSGGFGGGGGGSRGGSSRGGGW